MFKSKQKDLKQHIPAAILLFVLAIIALFMRLYATEVIPVAESIPFAFQLMIGGTALAIFRNELGYSTLGVFGPVILAFAWLEVGPFWGFILIGYVFIVTATARIALSGSDLGTAHRVASLLVIASIATIVLQIVGQIQGVPPLTTLLLFPIILTTWYAERFIQGTAEDGWAPASRRLTFTVVGVAVAFVVAGYEPLVNAVIRTPELWVALVGVNILLGASTNIRLAEYTRFRVLKRALEADNKTDVLTMRVRNRDYVSRYNPLPLMGLYNKSRMKQFLHGLNIPTPETFLIVETESDLEEFRALLKKRDRFVVKPIDGMGGRDVLVVRGREGDDGEFRTNRGNLTADEITSHTRKICVGGTADYGAKTSALVEALVTPESLLADRIKSGVPDLRVITLHGFPIMAMTRLPTDESKGTANIHTGAVAVAIDISSGKASGGYQQTQDRYVSQHPDTGASLSFTIPDWQDVLTTASRAAIASGFGYTGVDIVFDADQGPMVLEVNRRPGLGIQNANMAGLLGRLRFVEAQGVSNQFISANERVRRAIEWSTNNWQSDAADAPPDIDTKVEVNA
ncbi:sugar-transfer associated ATP-grasp domain-containing protein [Haloarcula japonica]|uniref:Alpha-L-glutamate ligase n=1 Tax=Haloarcula japonica (strain ATCC 49778 / DSM 6131 / JCM 7785 / NBRC 101032 / NCIMB 13157 / TR-1) TaxID=1227453 RepID=M0LCI6_HALJT|nr:sugar-transfer associated ATP-grasp domain-containing protein [Haloarcula japonica]EMA29665.1 alpha-L-glutamate ligase [Haloarcula japonica DSM 6131]